MTFASFHESNPVRLQGFSRQMNPRTIEQASWNRWSSAEIQIQKQCSGRKLFPHRPVEAAEFVMLLREGHPVFDKNGRVLRPGRSKLKSSKLAQLAFFTNSTFGSFFSIARLRSSARGERTSALALSRKASRPPR